MKKLIAVCGSDKFDEHLSQHDLQIAEEVGIEIAKHDAILVCGGRGGIMEAACKGAKKHNGMTIGILPFSKDEANKYIDVALPTHLGHWRNFLVVNSADAVIGIHGRWGTLNELSAAIILGKPTVVIQGTGGCADLLSEEIVVEKLEVTPHVVTSAKEAVEKALTLCV